MLNLVRLTRRAPSIVQRLYSTAEEGYCRGAIHPEIYLEEILDGSLERTREAQITKKSQERKREFLTKIEDSIKQDGVNPDLIGNNNTYCHVHYKNPENH
jgi:hypothetical protein